MISKLLTTLYDKLYVYYLHPYCYNGEKIIDRVLESIANYTYTILGWLMMALRIKPNTME